MSNANATGETVTVYGLASFDADPSVYGDEDVPPVFLVLDELKSVLKKWSTELDKKSFKSVESKVNQILALGRQLRG